ncbi:MAG: LrgB family protein [Streptococcus sp.]
MFNYESRSCNLLFTLPKSITAAIAIGVSDKLGGNSTITVGIVIITGILGAIIAKVFVNYLN